MLNQVLVVVICSRAVCGRDSESQQFIGTIRKSSKLYHKYQEFDYALMITITTLVM